MKILYLLFLACPLFAQPTLTTVTDIVFNADGNRYSGRLDIQSQSFTVGGVPILQNIKKITVVNGAFTVALAPNDTSVPPNTSYVFTFGNGTVWTCVIPTSANPVVASANCTNRPPSPALASVLLAQLNAIGATCTVCCLTRDATTLRITGLTDCSGGGGGGLALSTLSNGQLSTLSNGQLSTLSN